MRISESVATLFWLKAVAKCCHCHRCGRSYRYEEDFAGCNTLLSRGGWHLVYEHGSCDWALVTGLRCFIRYCNASLQADPAGAASIDYDMDTEGNATLGSSEEGAAHGSAKGGSEGGTDVHAKPKRVRYRNARQVALNNAAQARYR